MWKVTIANPDVEVIKYTDKKGAPAELRKQTAYFHAFGVDGTPGPFPDRFGFLLNRDQPAYPAGDYTLHPSALQVDRDGRLTCAVRLTPAAKR
jgi:hypothetical protein